MLVRLMGAHGCAPIEIVSTMTPPWPISHPPKRPAPRVPETATKSKTSGNENTTLGSDPAPRRPLYNVTINCPSQPLVRE